MERVSFRRRRSSPRIRFVNEMPGDRVLRRKFTQQVTEGALREMRLIFPLVHRAVRAAVVWD